ncbi:hypothetical protein [Andreprevotia chitinilytica]|uniref:hypothetical protein n=1 Tax=Andreprevotia chitinilytica TaxID=396808 RepID=UPI0005555346|nr:hypothetical protein [Andreprevotia chitinilytica]
MELVPRDIVIAAARMAMLDHLTPSQTMAVVLRAIDHDLMGPGGKPFNPARTEGIGQAVYAAMFGYPVEFVHDPLAANGCRWVSELPNHGYSQPFQQFFIDAMVLVDYERQRKRIALA